MLERTTATQGAPIVSGGILEVTSTSALPGYATPSKLTVGNGGTLVLSIGSGAWTTTNLSSLLTANSSGFTSGSMLGIDTSSSGTSGVSYTTAISGNMGLAMFGANR